jgi:hypothetical protein
MNSLHLLARKELSQRQAPKIEKPPKAEAEDGNLRSRSRSFGGGTE